MNEEFAAYFQARLEEITAGELFPRKSGGTAAPQVVRTQLPWRDADYLEGEELPLVVWAILGGEAASSPNLSSLEVLVACAVWTPGTVAEGSADIARLTGAVLRLSQDRAFSGFRLDSPVKYTLGEESDRLEPTPAFRGMQPHPYYKSRIYMNFTTGGISPRCNH